MDSSLMHLLTFKYVEICISIQKLGLISTFVFERIEKAQPKVILLFHINENLENTFYWTSLIDNIRNHYNTLYTILQLKKNRVVNYCAKLRNLHRRY